MPARPVDPSMPPAVRRFLTMCLILLLPACTLPNLATRHLPPEDLRTLPPDTPAVKVHMRNGELFVLHAWVTDDSTNTVTGRGTRYDPGRRMTVGDRTWTVPLDSAVLIETNREIKSGTATGFTVLAVLSGALTIACIANPKACFGSCPTFYLADSSGGQRLMAEGFSASIARVLEARDVDHLWNAAAGDTIRVTMTNEALETHMVRHVRLLAAERPATGRVVMDTKGAFHRVTGLRPPLAAIGPEGDIAGRVAAADGLERFSRADSVDLATRETIEVRFDPGGDGVRQGLVIAARHTLLSTFLFYQALAWMGHDAGHWLAELERGSGRVGEAGGGIGRELGGIAASAETVEGKWIDIGEINETGPLATDVKLLPLPDGHQWSGRLRLRMARGHWRIDMIAIGDLDGTVRPVRLEPTTVTGNATLAANAATMLADTTRYLTTLPGDTCQLTFALPDSLRGRPVELFLDSRGYYREWMRDTWLAEQDRDMAMMMFRSPRKALRVLAPRYKSIEATMDPIFWNSRYANPYRH